MKLNTHPTRLDIREIKNKETQDRALHRAATRFCRSIEPMLTSTLQKNAKVDSAGTPEEPCTCSRVVPPCGTKAGRKSVSIILNVKDRILKLCLPAGRQGSILDREAIPFHEKALKHHEFSNFRVAGQSKMIPPREFDWTSIAIRE
jgi:hypothetical protein